MTVCRDLKRFSRTNELVADLFSLMAAGLLFASVWVTLEFHQPALQWVDGNALVRMPMLLIALALNALTILALLTVGSSRFGDEERCFGTFAGRRTRHGSTGVLNGWIQHMESVGKKHR